MDRANYSRTACPLTASPAPMPRTRHNFATAVLTPIYRLGSLLHEGRAHWRVFSVGFVTLCAGDLERRTIFFGQFSYSSKSGVLTGDTVKNQAHTQKMRFLRTNRERDKNDE
jgi:hypothetical protein